jgi:hypothetical protein
VQDYPEHRLQFFNLLRAITNACFPTLFAMSPAQLKLVIDSIVWAFRHTERNVADTGLNLLLELLVMFEGSEFATQFHQTYYLQLMQEIFAVMTGASCMHAWPSSMLLCRVAAGQRCILHSASVSMLSPLAAVSCCQKRRVCCVQSLAESARACHEAAHLLPSAYASPLPFIRANTTNRLPGFNAL